MARALLVIDFQNDFTPPDGALAVAGGDEIGGPVRKLADSIGLVFATRDWHPPDHASFKTEGGPWPVHCVEGTPGWELHPDLRVEPDFRVYKARERDVEEYSAWKPELAEFLSTRGVRRVVLVGLALDYCVQATALDARAAGHEVLVLTDATRAVNVRPDDGDRALDALRAAGVREDRAGDQ